MEPFTIGLGSIAVRWIARLWVADTVAEGVDEDVLTLLGGRLDSGLQQRALARQLEAMTDNIAERLAPFMSAEIRGIDSGERESAANAARSSLEIAQAMNSETVVSADMDAEVLAKYVRQSDPGAVRRAGLGEAGAQLYDTLITECTSYVVSIAKQLPNFQTVQAAEMLSRSTHLIELTNQVLEELPSSSVPTEWGPGSEDQRFENKYRKAVAEFSSHLQLYGVTSTTAKSEYPLSVAYISLSVEVTSHDSASSRREDEETEWSDDGESVLSDGNLRIDALLKGSDYLLLSGNAGSGKTTLVQWLASSALENGTASHPRKTDWQGRVPFIIPLRRYVALPLPAPEEFVGTIAPLLTGAMPHSWVHRVLASGRGMLLIDGLDELPVERREEVRKWVLSLIDTFPSSKVLVTSRTTAVTRGWAEAHRFRKATLSPMELPDIRSFIYHWHEAAAAASYNSRSEDIASARKSLLSIVRDRPAIQSICNSPLLCALICALHLESGSNLPNNRMDVYKTALEMLVLRRDHDRNVDHIGDPELAYREREILLRSFALWMHENGASDATSDDYYGRITKQLAALYRVKASAEEVGRYLLERSGVLREPIPGRVDFVHRTFLEYLAAAAIVDDDSIERLILQADEDHWREVIVMAAGHANSQQRIQLLEGLLGRGDLEEDLRPRLYMLAVACMETSPDLPAALVARLQSALSAVLPPTNMTEATAVASAGTLAINMLGSNNQYATVAAACVRALSLIGGDEALSVLATYSRDTRVTVTRQLIRGWSGFDAEKYAVQILRESPLDHGNIYINDPDHLAQLHHLEHAESVTIEMNTELSDLSVIPAGHLGIRGLILTQPTLLSLNELPLVPHLEMLVLRRGKMADLTGIERYTRLRFLSVAQTTQLQDVSATNSLLDLASLDISGSSLSTLDSIDRENSLRRLRMVGASQLCAIRNPVSSNMVMVYFAPQLRDVSGLADSHDIKFLALHSGSSELEEIVLPPSLTQLRLDAEACECLKSINGSPYLETLNLAGGLSVALTEWVRSLAALTTIHWHSPRIQRGESSFAPVITQLFESPSLAKLHLWAASEPPQVSGVDLVWNGYSATYSRLT